MPLRQQCPRCLAKGLVHSLGILTDLLNAHFMSGLMVQVLGIWPWTKEIQSLPSWVLQSACACVCVCSLSAWKQVTILFKVARTAGQFMSSGNNISVYTESPHPWCSSEEKHVHTWIPEDLILSPALTITSVKGFILPQPPFRFLYIGIINFFAELLQEFIEINSYRISWHRVSAQYMLNKWKQGNKNRVAVRIQWDHQPTWLA